MSEVCALYHGTIARGLREIIPREHSVVYLTPNYAYALFYIVDKDINWITCGVKENGIVQYEEQFPNQLQTIYKGNNGSLYTMISTDAMESTANAAIWTAKKPVAVHAEAHIADVYAALLEEEQAGNIVVNRYADAANNRKREIHEMMVRYIHKSNLTEQSTKKSRFIRDNFPAAWDEVASHPENR